MKDAGLLFVATTRVNVSASMVLELLRRIARVIKDYLGVLSEESLRKNFVLVYELLDQVIVSVMLQCPTFYDSALVPGWLTCYLYVLGFRFCANNFDRGFEIICIQ